MITVENITTSTRELRKTSSDTYTLLQVETGKEYQTGVAIDPIEASYTYVETENEIPTFEVEP